MFLLYNFLLFLFSVIILFLNYLFIDVRPPSPVKEDDSDSEYYSDDSDED